VTHAALRLTHLVLAEQVLLLPEGEEDDIPVVGRVFDALILGSVLQHARRFVYDPVRAENGQQQWALQLRHVQCQVNHVLGVCVTCEAQGEELGHALIDAQVSMPVPALVLDEHQLHDLAADSGV